jgi:DNA-binding transcriptional ArsR family regulator
MERRKPKANRRDSSTYLIRDLAQLKAAADPLRVRLLEVIVKSPRTALELATLLGETSARIYHHLQALREVGLIRVVSEARKRGTVERRFGAIAGGYQVDPDLLSFGADQDAKRAALIDLIRTVLSGSSEEFARGIEDGWIQLSPERVAPFIETQELDLTDEQFTDLKASLDRWIASALAAQEKKRGTRRYRAVAAFYPLG